MHSFTYGLMVLAMVGLLAAAGFYERDLSGARQRVGQRATLSSVGVIPLR